MANTGAQLGQIFTTTMPAFSDVADIQRAFMMFYYGDPNADGPTNKGVEKFLTDIDNDITLLQARRTTDVVFSPTAPVRNTDDYSDWLWVDTSQTNPDGASRPLNIWSGAGWSQVAGAANPASNYDWTGLHTFSQKLKVNGPINSYDTPALRSAGLPTASNGTLSYTNGRYEYYKDGSWTPVGSIEKIVEVRSASETTMAEADGDKVLQFTNEALATYVIPTTQIKVGTSIYLNRLSLAPLVIVADSGVTLNARNSILGQYASATLTKTAADTWIMQGTGTALPPGGIQNQAPLKVDGLDYNVQWVSVVPATGGVYTGPVSFASLTASDANVASGALKIGGRKVYVQTAQPIGMATGDIWIQS